MRAWIWLVCLGACGNHRSMSMPPPDAADVDASFPICPPDPGTDVIGCPGIGFGLPSVAMGAAHTLSRLVDVNGDGTLDLIAPELEKGSVAVALGHGDGTFADPSRYAAGAQPVGLDVGDLSGDGAPDLAVVSQATGDNVVYLLVNNGDGTFAAATTLAVGAAPRAVLIGDIDPDGVADVIVASYDAASLTVLHGTGSGSFTAASYSVGFSPYRIALGKLDSDTHPELVAVGFSATMAVLHNQGNGTFAAAQGISIAGGQGNDVAVADFNGDGQGDVAVAGTNGVEMFSGTGNGGLGLSTSYPFTVANGLGVADLDRDGKVDLAVVGWSGLGTLLSGSSGFTQTTIPFLSPSQGPDAVATGDIDGDGDPDLALASVNNINNGIALVRNPGNAMFAAPKLVESTLSGAAAADLDGDKRADVVVIDTQLRVYVNDALTASYALTTYGYAVAFGDVDGDGHTDVAVSTRVDVEVFRGTGTGGLAPPVTYPIGSDAFGLELVDLDRDCRPELVMSHPSPPALMSNVARTIGILHNNGDGTFAPQVTYPVGEVMNPVAVADLDGDHIVDIAVAAGSPPELHLLHGVGDGTFTSPASVPGIVALAVAAADLDADSHTDLIITTAANQTTSLAVLRGHGDGTFELHSTVATGAVFQSPIGVVDLDGDGHHDVVMMNELGIVIHLGHGDGTFGPPLVYNMPGRPWLAGDLDGDHRLDLVVSAGGHTQNDGRIYEVFGSCAP